MLYLGGDFLKKFLAVIASTLVFFFTVSFSAFAAPVVVPVAGGAAIAKLLVALGVLVVGADGGYYFAKNDNPYVESIFESQIGVISSDIPISEETLGKLENTVIPSGVYETDGENFFLIGQTVPVSDRDFYLLAKSLVAGTYFMPVNIEGSLTSSGSLVDGAYWSCNVPSLYDGKYFFPVAQNQNDTYFRPLAFSILSRSIVTTNTVSFDFARGTYGSTDSLNATTPLGKYFVWTGEANQSFLTTEQLAPLSLAQITNNLNQTWLDSSGRVFSSDLSGIVSSTLLVCDGVPLLELKGSSVDLGDSLVQVKPSNDDDNNGSTPPVPVSPNNWEIWKNLDDLVKFIDTGEITNGGSTYGDFVNNNYNYVDIDINVPDNVNVNLGGGLDISGSGNINVNVNENISVPSVEGEGDKFYNLTLWDSLAALVSDNPMITAVSSLVRAIDPQLVALCSVSISLIIVLAIWRFIRGG